MVNKIFIATHKKYDFPQSPDYIPIHVGKALNPQNELNILSDDTMDNISLKNNSFCELTALYWIWKNNFLKDIDYVGLVHYRRYFTGKELTLKNHHIASVNELFNLIDENSCVVAKKRNYYIETIYSHYKNAHFIEDLNKVKEIIIADYPEYYSAFDEVLNGTTLHLFNMFFIHKKHFVNYCEWVFNILFKLEKQINISNYDQYQKRVFGFLAERLFNVWLKHNNINIIELPVVNIEGENKLYKFIGLMKRKFLQS